MRLNINSSEVVNFTNTLEKMHKSALPNAIRGALNSAAFDVKQNTMPKKAATEFIKRQPNFFKANSRVEMAKGFNINHMQATVGFTETGLKGGNNYAVKDLEQQEEGGSIDKKSFIPLSGARVGGSRNKSIRSNARLSGIKKIIDIKNSSGKNQRERFVIAASVAGKGGFVLRNNILFKIDTAPSSNLGNKKANFKATALYTFKKGRSVNVKATGFMKKASIESANQIEDFFIREANRQFIRLK